MITFFLGDVGHGKSTKIIECIKKDVDNKKRSLLIVPEQETLFCERVIASKPFDPSAQLYTEVLSFSRLANKFFRRHGGLRYNYATRSDKNLVMYSAICEAKAHLKYYTNITKGREYTCVKLFLDAIGELKAYGITTERLKEKADNLEGSLKARLNDLMLIWSIYEKTLKKSFDDSYDDILNLATGLEEVTDFFKDVNVYIDSFNGFTQAQIDVLKHILIQAENVTFAFDCPSNVMENPEQYSKVADAINRIKAICPGEHTIKPFNEDYKHKNKTITYLTKNVWSFTAEAICDYEGITLAQACDEFEECEYICSRIKELVLDGARYNEIAIIMRDAEKYRGLIDYALRKYEIPYFLSTAVDVMSIPAVKMIFCALRAITTYRPEDVISYVKCSYLDISENELNEFESYIFRWNIYGKRFKEEDYWASNPDGYIKSMNKAQKRAWCLVLSSRKKVLEKLSILENAFAKGATIEECANAIFKFLEAHNVKGEIEKELSSCTKQEAYELSQVWNVLLRALDTLSSVCKGAIVTPQDLSVILSYALMDTEIGSIPPGNDVVVIGDARTIRAKNIKHTFIAGVNEGVFPASIHDDGFFSDADKIALEGEGIDLSSKSDTRANDELINFKNAIGTASNTVTITCLKTNISGEKLQPSNAFVRVNELLLDYLPINISMLDPIDKIYSMQGALEYLPHVETPLGIAIKQYFNIDRVISSDFSNTRAEIDKEDAKELVGKKISLSKSSIETFKHCKFKYYCTEVLRLNSTKRITFASNDVGNLAHFVLEAFLKLCKDGRVDIHTITDTELKAVVDEIVEGYISLICYSRNVSKRLRFLFNKLKKNLIVYLKNLIAELKQSDFKDEYHELDMAGDGENAPFPLEFKLSDGRVITLKGTADRVDIYRDGDTAYVRIVDYKSGTENTDIDKLDSGFGMQLFIYLFTICKLNRGSFRDKLLKGNTDLEGVTKIVPAGVMYFPMNIDKKSIGYDADFGSDDVGLIERATIEEKYARSGYFLDNEAVILAQDKKRDGSILPVKEEEGSRKTSTKTPPYIPQNKFDEAFNTIESTIKAIGAELLSGDASAIPVKNPNKASSNSPCAYCELKAICRRKSRVKEDE